MRQAELVLRVVGALVRGIELEKLAILVGRENEVVRAAFFEIRVADSEFRVGPIRTLCVRLNHLFEVLAGGNPLSRVQGHVALVEEKLVRFDMSEFMNQRALGILVGSSIGERGLFGHYYDRSLGSGTLLFDEIEKAHPLVMDIFLQILSAGRFTLANGETLDLTNYVVVATTNIGSRLLMESRRTDRETLIRRTLQAGTQDLRPETFARFDLHCVFNKLGYEVLKEIAAVHLDKTLGLINSQSHSVRCESGVLEYLQREGYSEKFGARPMQNAAMRTVGELVAQAMLCDSGRPIKGAIAYDKEQNRCFLRSGA